MVSDWPLRKTVSDCEDDERHSQLLSRGSLFTARSWGWALAVFLKQAERADGARSGGSPMRLPGSASSSPAAVVRLYERAGPRVRQFGMERHCLDRRRSGRYVVPRDRRLGAAADPADDDDARACIATCRRGPPSPCASEGVLHLPAHMLQTGMIGRLRGARLLPVLRVLGSDAGADVLPHRDLGQPDKLYAAIKFFLYTLVGSRGHAARHPGLSTSTTQRDCSVGGPGGYEATSRCCSSTRSVRRCRSTCSGGCSSPSSSASRSRCRCSPSTPGCPMLTSRRRPPGRSSWPASS